MREAEVRFPRMGQLWGHLKVEGGVSHWVLSAARDGGEREPQLVDASFEGIVPRVFVSGGSVHVAYAWWTGWAAESPGATLGLSTVVPWSIVVHGGAQALHANLAEVRLAELSVYGGAQDVLLELAAPLSRVPIRIHGRVHKLTIVRPHATALRLAAASGANDLRLDDAFFPSMAGGVAWQSDHDLGAAHYDVVIRGSAERVIVARASPRPALVRALRPVERP